MYWAEALAEQDKDQEVQKIFGKAAEDLKAAEATIIQELNDAQGSRVDIGGYYKPDTAKTSGAMRPSNTLNSILETVKA